MRIDAVPHLICPKCQKKGKWTFDGYSSGVRYSEGILTCENNHQWKISQDVLRFDTENSTEEMVFLDHELTGYPKEVNELERASFLNHLEKMVADLKLDNNPVVIVGSSILFFRYLSSTDKNLIVIHHDEGILRQIQQMVAQKQLFSSISFIRSDKTVLDEDLYTVSFLPADSDQKNLPKNGVLIDLVSSPKPNVIWKGESTNLIVSQS